MSSNLIASLSDDHAIEFALSFCVPNDLPLEKIHKIFQHVCPVHVPIPLGMLEDYGVDNNNRGGTCPIVVAGYNHGDGGRGCKPYKFYTMFKSNPLTTNFTSILLHNAAHHGGNGRGFVDCDSFHECEEKEIGIGDGFTKRFATASRKFLEKYACLDWATNLKANLFLIKRDQELCSGGVANGH